MTTAHILLAGVGGQGTILASKLLAQAAMDAGLPVHTAETIGMAQRGGSVVSHVRVGDGAFGPLIPPGGADVLIGFEPAEAARCLGYLKPGGLVVTGRRAIVPFTCSLSGKAYVAEDMLAYLRANAETVAVNGEAVCRAAGSDRVLNVALLGAASATGALPFDTDALARTIEHFLPEKIRAINLTALRLGAEAVRGA